jgi:hypothetical protein
MDNVKDDANTINFHNISCEYMKLCKSNWPIYANSNILLINNDSLTELKKQLLNFGNMIKVLKSDYNKLVVAWLTAARLDVSKNE